jgi:hypothetical protein
MRDCFAQLIKIPLNFVLHALNLIIVLDQHKKIIESSYFTTPFTHPNISLVTEEFDHLFRLMVHHT